MNLLRAVFYSFAHRLSPFFSVDRMLKPADILGPIPGSKRAYSTFFTVAWPSALESLLVGLVGSVDTMMVGSLGQGAIAAVGITNQPKFILLAMIFSLNVGVTAVVARRKGQGDKGGANHVLRIAILLSLGISIGMSLLGFLFAKEIMLVAGAEEEYLQDAVDYFRILVIGIVFTSLNLTINAAQRGCGNTKIAMKTNIIANVINLIFNYLLINGIGPFPRMEVRGAAVATVLGAVASLIISILALLKKDSYVNLYHRCSWKFQKTVLTPIMRVSSSALIEQVFMRIGFLAYASIVARLGTTPYATHLICMNILNLSFCFGDGFGIAASSLVGQNLGAKRPDIASIYGKIGQRIAFAASTIIFLVFIFGRHSLIWLFNKDTEVILLGGQIMILMALSTHFQTSQVVLNGCLRGAGDSAYVAVTSMISIAIVRPVLTWILCFPLGLGLPGAWISLIIDQGFRFLASFTRFNSGKWSRIQL